MDNMRYKIWDKSIIDSEIIQEIEIPSFDINLECNEDNWSLLMAAVYMDRKELVRYLLLSFPGINVNQRNNFNYTALHFCNKVSILKLLLSCKDIDVNIQNYEGETGLHLVCYYYRECKVYIREYLLDARVNVLIRDNSGQMAQDIALRRRYPMIAKIINNSRYTSLLQILNRALLHDIVRMIIEEYV